MFAPVIVLAFVLDHATHLSPIADCCEHVGLLTVIPIPKVDHHGLSSRLALKTVRYRKPAVRVSVILSESEERAMPSKNFQRSWLGGVDLYLYIDWIRVNIHEPSTGALLVSGLCPAMQVEYCHGSTV